MSPLACSIIWGKLIPVIHELVGQYKSSREIADQLLISERTVNNHRMNITRKLELTGKNSLLRFAIEQAGP